MARARSEGLLTPATDVLGQWVVVWAHRVVGSIKKAQLGVGHFIAVGLVEESDACNVFTGEMEVLATY